MRVAVGTTSEIKLQAVVGALSKAGFVAEMRGYPTLSDVPKQPFSREEIMEGAKNRAVGAIFEDKQADYGIGIESGIFREGSLYFEIASCVIVDKNKEVAGVSFSAAVETPRSIVDKIKEKNSEAGVVVAEITGNPTKDPISYYTGGKTSRADILQDAVLLALSRHLLNPEAYKEIRN